jgi:hypothetical protein
MSMRIALTRLRDCLIRFAFLRYPARLEQALVSEAGDYSIGGAREVR